jgi:hypothetical protein
MNPSKQAVDDREGSDVLDVPESSFHGRLLSRSIKSLPDPRKRRPPFKRPARTGRLVVLVVLVRQVVIFAGGMGIGGGMMLLEKGEPLKGRPALMIGGGIALVVASILLSLAARELTNSETSAARG